MDEDPLGLGDIERRTRNAFRIAFKFIVRLEEENELLKKRVELLEKQIKNLMRIGEN